MMFHNILSHGLNSLHSYAAWNIKLWPRYTIYWPHLIKKWPPCHLRGCVNSKWVIADISLKACPCPIFLLIRLGTHYNVKAHGSWASVEPNNDLQEVSCHSLALMASPCGSGVTQISSCACALFWKVPSVIISSDGFLLLKSVWASCIVGSRVHGGHGKKTEEWRPSMHSPFLSPSLPLRALPFPPLYPIVMFLTSPRAPLPPPRCNLAPLGIPPGHCGWDQTRVRAKETKEEVFTRV